MVTVPDVYYYYRKNPTSTVASKSLKHKKDYQWAMRELRDFAEKNDIEIIFRNRCERKVRIKLFNITIMKIYYRENIVHYKLLGFIPFLKIIKI